MNTLSTPWPLASRTRHMAPSAVREILKVTQQPGVLSLAGGLPAPEAFPLQALAQASERVWATQGAQAMQYATSEGLPALREWIARRLTRPGWEVLPEQVLITTGSQQGLDLLGRVLLEPGEPLLLEQPTFLGALQSFAPYRPQWQAWPLVADGPDATEGVGPDPQALRHGQRAAYLVPSYQNPTGACLSLAQRQALVDRAATQGVPLIEDDPYGELWYDAPTPAPLAALAPEQVVHLGSFSKVLAPGLRLGYLVCPRSQMDTLGARLLQAKQGADLHSCGFSQRLVMQLMNDGFDMSAHLSQVRDRYRSQRDAMATSLLKHMPQGWHWRVPSGGMFFWLQGPAGVDTMAWLPQAVQAGVAFVPGGAFEVPDANGQPVHASTMRLSFVTLSPEQIDLAVQRLATTLSAGRGDTLERCL
jgi:2-aminoadipate transaminase